MDILYVGVALLFFVSSWGLMKLCQVLDNQKSGEQS